MANVMCSTKQNDVKDAVKEMKKQGVDGTLTQVGKKLYGRLDKDHSEAMEVEEKRNQKYTINRTTETLHLDDCKSLKRVKDGCKISAAIVNIPASGLKTCGSCM